MVDRDDDAAVDSWERYSLMVISQLKELKSRFDSLESHLEKKLDRTLMSFKSEQDVLRNEVVALKIELAVLKKDISLKTTILAAGISLGMSIIVKLLFS